MPTFSRKWLHFRLHLTRHRTGMTRTRTHNLLKIGGEGGDRTHGPVARTAVFETARFGHSRTSPYPGPTRICSLAWSTLKFKSNHALLMWFSCTIPINSWLGKDNSVL